MSNDTKIFYTVSTGQYLSKNAIKKKTKKWLQLPFNNRTCHIVFDLCVCVMCVLSYAWQKKRKEKEEKKWTFSCLVFSNSIKVSETNRVHLILK